MASSHHKQDTLHWQSRRPQLICQSVRLRVRGWTRWCALVVFLGVGSACGDVHSRGAEVAARISRVENGLLRAIVIQGRPNGLALEDRMSFHKVPGVSIAVINESRVEWAKGYGILQAGSDRLVNTETLFQAASISKPVTALAALRTVDMGLIALDDAVNNKLRSWLVPDNEFTARSKVTLRGLLSHSAGLTVHGFRGYAPDEPVPSLLQILDGTGPANSAPIRVDIIPGTAFRYSGGGYTVLQQLLIDLHGKPFPEVMREIVLDPVGMVHSTYEQPLPEARVSNAAVGHRRDGEPVPGLRHTYPEMAAAGLWATASDLATFALEIARAWSGEEGRTISREMTEEMFTPLLEDYGLGVFIGRNETAWNFNHGGLNEGFECELLVYPELGMGAVIMTNGDQGRRLAVEILRAISAEYGWTNYLPRVKVLDAVPAETYDRYVGRYMLDVGAEVTISKEDERLLMTLDELPVSELLPESETAFFCLELNTDIRFIGDSTGAYDEIAIVYRGQHMNGARVE